eukprot:4991964-Pyramimonas_sp.AAC.1
MNPAMFPDFYAQTTGAPPVWSQSGNPCVRATADDFHRSQLTRGAGYKIGIPGQVPHCGYLAAPMDHDVNPHGPELVVPASPGEL